MSLILQYRRAQARRLSSVWSERPAAIPALVTLLLLAGLAAPAQAAPLTLGAAEAQLARSNPSLAAAAQRGQPAHQQLLADAAEHDHAQRRR